MVKCISESVVFWIVVDAYEHENFRLVIVRYDALANDDNERPWFRGNYVTF